jgi:hypothetical protein
MSGGTSDLQVRIGGNEIAVTALTLRTSIHALPEAEFTFQANELADYLMPVTVGPIDGEPIFDGTVLVAQPGDSGIAVRCRGAVSLTETLAPGGTAQDCSPMDLFYAMARGAGFPEDRIVISHLEDLPHEPIEVSVPLIGIEVERDTAVGPVQLGPPSVGEGILERFHPDPDLGEEFLTGLVFARAYRPSARLYDAEQDGLAQIETALSWLVVRANYGFVSLPDGSPQRFDRANAVARPRRLPVIAVRGMDTGRRWMRRPPGDRVESRLVFDAASQLDSPKTPRDLPASDVNALEAARRATDDGDIALRVHALWEAFEFYVAKRSSPSLFSQSDRQKLLAAAEFLSVPQRDRLAKVVNGPLNDTPLMDKLLATLSEEGIQTSDDDLAVLSRLRKARNLTMHGHSALPTPDDLKHGWALLTRALVVRVARRSGES